MLIRFEVENYKGFKNNIVWDLTKTHDYSFSKSLVKNKISKNSIIYGENASGKTTLCAAIVDLTTHLLDVEKDQTPPYMYTYIGNNSSNAHFKYYFKFGKNNVLYEYIKSNNRNMIFEALIINDKIVVYHDYTDESKNFISLPDAKNLRTNGLQPQLSVIKYIYNNTIIDNSSIIFKLIDFVKGMLYFRSLREANQYIGYKIGSDRLDDIILKNNRLENFNNFLSYMGLHYELVPLKLSSGNLVIGAKFENGNVIGLNEIASSGTKTLILFYCWMQEFNNLTFLIIDEFDAYYHYEISCKILSIINQFENLQSMVTTHNVTLLNTDKTRPDCAYIIDNSGVRNLSSRTNKELRKNHNIEKLYRQGEFNL